MIQYAKDVAQAAGTLFAQKAEASVAANGRFVVVLSGRLDSAQNVRLAHR